MPCSLTSFPARGLNPGFDPSAAPHKRTPRPCGLRVEAIGNVHISIKLATEAHPLPTILEVGYIRRAHSLRSLRAD